MGTKEKNKVFCFFVFWVFVVVVVYSFFSFLLNKEEKEKLKSKQINKVIGKAERSDPQQTCNSSSCPEVGFMKVNSFVCGSLPYLGFSANRGVFHFAKGIIPICLFVFNFI